MNKPTERIDEREWQMQERALREERFGAAAGDDPGIAAYRHVARALREPLPDALPSDFAEAIAAQAARLPVRGESALERWLVRLLYVAFVVSALYFVAQDGGAWLRASVSLLPTADMAAVRSWGLALGACVGMTWGMARVRDPFKTTGR